MTWEVYCDFDYNFDWVFDFTTPGDDISAYIKEVQIQQGASNELTLVASVGTASLTLNNEDFRFSPAKTTGPYYGKLMARKPIRIRWIEGSTAYPLMLGYITDIVPQGGIQGQIISSECKIQLEDVMGLLQGNISLPIQASKTADFLILAAINAALNAPAATNTLEWINSASNTQTVTINGVTFTLVYTLTATPNQVLLQGRLDDTMFALVAAINGAEGVGTLYSAGSTKVPNVTAVYFPQLTTRCTMWHKSADVLAGNALSTTIDTAMAYTHFTAQTAAANGDTFTNSFFVQHGTYYLSVLGNTDPNAGKIDWYVDNVLVLSGQDWYAAVGVKNTVQRFITPFTIAADGYHVIKGVINGKNASSGGFKMNLVKYWVQIGLTFDF